MRRSSLTAACLRAGCHERVAIALQLRAGPENTTGCPHQLRLEVVTSSLGSFRKKVDRVLLRLAWNDGEPVSSKSICCEKERTAKVSGSSGALMLRFLWRMRVPPSCGFSTFALRQAGGAEHSVRPKMSTKEPDASKEQPSTHLIPERSFRRRTDAAPSARRRGRRPTAAATASGRGPAPYELAAQKIPTQDAAQTSPGPDEDRRSAVEQKTVRARRTAVDG